MKCHKCVRPASRILFIFLFFLRYTMHDERTYNLRSIRSIVVDSSDRVASSRTKNKYFIEMREVDYADMTSIMTTAYELRTIETHRSCPGSFSCADDDVRCGRGLLRFGDLLFLLLLLRP